MNIQNWVKEFIGFAKTLALIAITIVFAAFQVEDKLSGLEKNFDKVTQSIDRLDHTMQMLTIKIDNSEKRFDIIEKDIKEIKAHTGMK